MLIELEQTQSNSNDDHKLVTIYQAKEAKAEEKNSQEQIVWSYGNWRVETRNPIRHVCDFDGITITLQSSDNVIAAFNFQSYLIKDNAAGTYLQIRFFDRTNPTELSHLIHTFNVNFSYNCGLSVKVQRSMNINGIFMNAKMAKLSLHFDANYC